MQPKKIIELLLNTVIVGVPYRIELFHALANRAESYAANHLNNQPGFVSFNIPLLTAEGIQSLQATGVRNLNYWLNDKMSGTDGAGLQTWTIESAKGVNYSYRSMLNYLASRTIRIGKVKIIGTAADIKNTWTLRRYFIDGTKTSEDIVLSNMISPEQVQSGILEFNLDKLIDGGTAIEILMNPGASLYVAFEFEELQP